jgi:hypothetical protein
MGKIQGKLEKIKEATLNSPYIFYFIIIFIAYIFLNLFLNKTFFVFHVLTSLPLYFVIPFFLFNLLIVPFLVALTVNLIILRLKETKSLRTNQGGLAFFGVVGGIFGGACPACLIGLLPAILGLFGFTITLSKLPFLGIGLQVVSSIFLIVAIVLLTRDLTCKVEINL